jgi:Kef-type K+ transport system membrane component KefB
MEQEAVFNGFSFFSGVFTGFILRWTDIIPILGGFIFGMTVRRIPDLVNMDGIPDNVKTFMTEKAEYTKNMIGNIRKPAKKMA